MNTTDKSWADTVNELHNLDALIRRLERETKGDWRLSNSKRQMAMEGAVNARIRELNATINYNYYKISWSPQPIWELDNIDFVKACADYQSPEDIAEAKAELHYELLAAFGAGETVVDITTGEKILL